MTPPDGEMVDASGFWAQRNGPAPAESEPPEPELAANESAAPDLGKPDPPVSGGWVRYRDYLPKERVPRPLGFKRLLVANRGEIACRIFRTASELGLETVAIVSDPDRDSLHAREANVVVAIGGTTSAESYLDTGKILDAARRTGADAIHPGYGFLSENAEFAQAVIDEGITWVGPSPESIRSMALKVEAKHLAAQAGVPLVPGAELAGDVSVQELGDIATDVGFPLLVKASAGGGGKGMRVVDGPDGLIEAVETARREALNSFGDPTVFFERYLAGARHVEVQVFGDNHGNVVHLFERECSIQRRHQKIIEESPSPGASTETLNAMYDASVALARQINYVGAGTVEFLVFGEGEAQEFYFLEMNTRLQVEHPVTEAITGLDLVVWQLQVASGNPLPLSQHGITRFGHAIEARLYAEDPANGYLPSTGVLESIEQPPIVAENHRYCRVDSGFDSGDEVTPYYDPMLAKFTARGDSRAEAAETLANTLRSLQVAGVTTNRDSLVAILESAAFASGETATDFLDRRPELLSASLIDAGLRTDFAMAATVARTAVEQTRAAWRDIAFSGWRNVASVPQRIDWSYEDAGDVLNLAVVSTPTSRTTGRVEVRDRTLEAGFAGPVEGVEYRITSEWTDDEDPALSWVHRIELDGIARNYAVSHAAEFTWVSDGRNSVTFRHLPRFTDPDLAAASGGPAAPVPGTVVAVEVAVGDAVEQGQTLVVLEAMKMEHRITAAADGVVGEVLVTAGDSVDAHQILVTFE